VRGRWREEQTDRLLTEAAAMRAARKGAVVEGKVVLSDDEAAGMSLQGQTLTGKAAQVRSSPLLLLLIHLAANSIN
jgi:hypothetical protein